MGILLIIVGILVLSYQGITYTQSEKVAEISLPQIGQLKVVEERTKNLHFPPLLGGLSLVVGIGLVIIARVNKNK